jgi:hypothetical protein
MASGALRVGGLTVAGVLAVVRAVAASDADCPPAIEVEQRAAPPVGWSLAAATGPRPLARVTFYDGPPDQLASLKYDDRTERADEWIATWHFPRNPRGYWVTCGYEGTTVTLARELPAAARRCQVIYARIAAWASGLPLIRSMNCR